jgi:hypothetical protein
VPAACRSLTIPSRSGRSPLPGKRASVNIIEIFVWFCPYNKPIKRFNFRQIKKKIIISVADQGSGAFLTPGSGIRDPGYEIRDHISDSLATIFWVKILKFLDAEPGWKTIGYGMDIFGFGINIEPRPCRQQADDALLCELRRTLI